MARLQNLNGLCQKIVDFQSGKISVEELAAAGETATTTDPGPSTSAGTSAGGSRTATLRVRMPKHSPTASTSSDEPPFVHEAESKLLGLFPINVYTPAMDWLLQQTIVKKFLYFEVLKKVYSDLPSTKPDIKIVISEFYDYTISPRLGAHLGKSTGKAAGLQFGRFPFPATLVNIAERNLASLHRERLPTTDDVSGLLRNRTNAAKRNYLTTSKYLNDSESMQVMAQRLYWERMDFYNHHRVSSCVSIDCRYMVIAYVAGHVHQRRSKQYPLVV